MGGNSADLGADRAEFKDKKRSYEEIKGLEIFRDLIKELFILKIKRR